jgi:hypothetical protein
VVLTFELTPIVEVGAVSLDCDDCDLAQARPPAPAVAARVLSERVGLT